jgi:hypothetical protein
VNKSQAVSKTKLSYRFVAFNIPISKESKIFHKGGLT